MCARKIRVATSVKWKTTGVIFGFLLAFLLTLGNLQQRHRTLTFLLPIYKLTSAAVKQNTVNFVSMHTSSMIFFKRIATCNLMIWPISSTGRTRRSFREFSWRCEMSATSAGLHDTATHEHFVKRIKHHSLIMTCFYPLGIDSCPFVCQFGLFSSIFMEKAVCFINKT